MERKTITFSELAHFHPRQEAALEATKKHKYVLYGGAMGGGKSYFLRWACVYWLLALAKKYQKKGIRAVLFCEDYGALNDRHISKLKLEFPRSLGTYNEQKHEFQLHPRFGSGVLAFRNLDDPSKYVSSEFAIIAVDEVIRDNYATFSILRTRLRWVGIPEVRFIAASNPPPGEPWVKRYWIDRNFPPEERESEQFYYIPALPTDNPHLDESYFESLKSLDERERKAYLEADWTAFDADMDEEGWMRLLSDAQLQDALTDDRTHVGDIVLGVDPAAGGDRSAVVAKSETLKEVVFSQKLKNVLDLVPVISKAVERFGRVGQIVVDRTGVGEGLYQRLKELKFPVKGVGFGERASKPERFDNMKAELYWKERLWLLAGGKLLRHPSWNDFINIKYKEYNEKTLRIQGKEELRKQGFKSPDTVDAAVLTNYANKNLGFDALYKQTRFVDKMESVWDNR